MVLTPLTLHATMKADPGLMEVGGHAYLAGLAQAAPALPERPRSMRASCTISPCAASLIRHRRGHRQYGLRSAA